MTQWLSIIVLYLAFPIVLLCSSGLSAAQTVLGSASEARDMALVGFNDLQGRSAYQPIIQQQGGRFIAYIGHHGGAVLNPLNGKTEPHGTSVVDVTDPNNPTFVSTVIADLTSTHKNWWECDTGIAYIVAHKKEEGWRSRGVKIFDLSDPAHPRYIRDYGVVGQEPGSSGEPVPAALHGPIRLGNRVYFGYGTSAGGILQIVDHDKLLRGDPTSPNPFAPTAHNILYAQIGRLDTSPHVGAHTTFPVLGIHIPELAKNQQGQTADFVVLVNEAIQNECREQRQMVFLVDVTTPSKPFSVANFQVPEASGNFCTRGGRFGAHASNESFTPIYYRRLVFISYFNAGVRVVDIRDPYRPQEVAFYIPAITEKTDKRCVPVTGGGETCKVAIQTNNVEVDDRGYIYIVDRANTGMHILELTGAARKVANLPSIVTK